MWLLQSAIAEILVTCQAAPLSRTPGKRMYNRIAYLNQAHESSRISIAALSLLPGCHLWTHSSISILSHALLMLQVQSRAHAAAAGHASERRDVVCAACVRSLHEQKTKKPRKLEFFRVHNLGLLYGITFVHGLKAQVIVIYGYGQELYTLGMADRRGKHKSNDCRSRGQCCSIPGQAKPVSIV